mmetsp:Transcript_5352/g.6158  ORF Transcript_5352/g.6158 Transcript_5352/m.6158 type:complete len:453 (-) Transcript_5352:242-1600(-)
MMHHSILLFVAVVGGWTVIFSNARRLHQPIATVVDKQQHKHQYADVAAAAVHTNTADGVAATMEHNNNRRRLTRSRRLQTPYGTVGYSSGYDTAYSNYADPAAQQQQSYVDPYAAYDPTQPQTQQAAQQAAQQAQAQFPAAPGQYSQYQGQPQVAQTQPQGQTQTQTQTQYQQSYDTYTSYEQPQATQGQGQYAYQTPPQAAQPPAAQGQYEYEYQTQAEIQAASQARAQAQAAAQAAAAQAQVQPQPQIQAQQQPDPYTYLSSPYSTNTFARPEGSTPRPEGVTGPYVASSTTTWVGYGGDDYDYDYDHDTSYPTEAPTTTQTFVVPLCTNKTDYHMHLWQNMTENFANGIKVIVMTKIDDGSWVKNKTSVSNQQDFCFAKDACSKFKLISSTSKKSGMNKAAGTHLSIDGVEQMAVPEEMTKKLNCLMFIGDPCNGKATRCKTKKGYAVP